MSLAPGTAPAPQSQAAIPSAPLILGLSGLLPFWALALGIPFTPIAGYSAGTLATALAGYGAVILSFLGGIRWGLATRQTDQRVVALQYLIAVVPSLIGWAALGLNGPWRLLVLGLVILALGPIDRRLIAEGLAPPWYGRLRIILSLGAGLALLLGAWVSRAS
ncbi:DUF3429 domain-containing protein [Lichenihabitans psoromatis]|uniref:DUF3429 domain-containing protein n=1 Tax=Lichenihabitans psoromatis TaxID=2528642 RepID=UPI001FDFA71A|nr:DUF3429 domain-containing protein [Lichenihabitans psoromatis]